MPTYTYKCNECNHQFEVKQKISDDRLTDCPKCEQQHSLQKILTPSGGFRIGGLGVHKPTTHWGDPQ